MVTFQQRLGGGEGTAMEISRERAFLAEGAPSSGGWITHVHSNSINQARDWRREMGEAKGRVRGEVVTEEMGAPTLSQGLWLSLDKMERLEHRSDIFQLIIQKMPSAPQLKGSLRTPMEDP